MGNRKQPPDAFLRRVMAKRDLDDETRRARLDEATRGPAGLLVNLEDLSQEDLLTLLRAREVLDRQATKRPRAAKAPRSVAVDQGTKVDWRKAKRTCPRCGHTGPVDPDFGVKVVRDVERPQSWCKSCRAGTNYHGRPRKYQIKI